MKVILYISNFNKIGGVETSVINFAKVMSSHCDLSVVFDKYESLHTLETVANYCTIIQADAQKEFNCDVFIQTTAWGRNIQNKVNAKKQIQIVHADYSYYIKGWNFKYEKHPKTTHHVCVGETVAEAFEKATPYKSDGVIYNFLDPHFKPIKKPKNKKLTLITVSRISGEKGFLRKKQLAEFLDKKGIDYTWDIWGNLANPYAQNMVKSFEGLKNVNFKGVTFEPLKEIANADYLVQLSDTEGYCYSVCEALQTNTPCLITPFRSGDEQIKDGVNGYILPFEMDNINLDKIINQIPKQNGIKEKTTPQDWINLFS